MRFRNYLGLQYQSSQTLIDEHGNSTIKALPIISIYFLGFELNNPNLPAVLHINREYKDAITGDIINEKDEFTDCLTHDSYIIQIPKLHLSIKTKIEKILTIFDQKSITGHVKFLNYTHRFKDDYIKLIIKRLQKAYANPKIKKQLEDEEEYGNEIMEREEKIAKQAILIEKERQRADTEQQIAEKERQKAEKERQKAENERQKAEKERQRAEDEHKKNEATQKLLENEQQKIKNMITAMKNMGIPLDTIAGNLGLSVDEIHSI
jgi:hypothetical protein